MIDVVYILGDGSRWRNNEIRYSIRSLEKHCKDLGRIFVVGCCPNWLKGVIHIPCDDPYPEPEQNTLHKTLIACGNPDISELFFKLDDDFFFLQDFLISETPVLNKGLLTETLKRLNQYSRYTRVFENTIAKLENAGLPMVDYEVHNPVIYEKSRFKAIMKVEEKPICMKSVYFNQMKTDSIEGKDMKINRPFSYPEIETATKSKQFFSVGDIGLNPEMKTFIEQKYLVASGYEKGKNERV